MATLVEAQGLQGRTLAPNALEMFRAALAESPDAQAVCYFDSTLTYRQLDEMSDAFGAALEDQGVEPGDRVALYLQNTPHFMIAMLGAWKAGAIVSPLNVMNRQRELTLLFADSEPKALVLNPELHRDVFQRLDEGVSRPRLLFGANPFDFQSRNDARVLPASIPARSEGLADLLDTVQRYAGRKPKAHPLAPDDVAYIVYTSGTTGKPKGAMLLHRNVVASTPINQTVFKAERGARILGMAPLFHVTGLMTTMNLAFSVGGCVVLAYRFDPAVMVEAIREHRATHVLGAATAFIAMMNSPGARPEDMASLKVAGSGGAPTPPAIVAEAERFLGVTIQNGYGLTETAIATHSTPRDAKIPVDPASGALSVGPANPGFTAWVEGADGQPAPDGEAGEIVVSGPTVAAGYWRNPEETAAAFRPDGFRTGDVGVRDADGWYYLVDRKKDMISASGFKVWPREVEDVLYGHPAVREAAVVGVPDPYRGETVRAVVSLKPNVSASEAEILAYCRETMAAYKCPRELRIIEELPKTASGKILRRELRD